MNVKLLNPLTLAYMGDAVLDQHVREYIVLKLQSKPHHLHQVSKSYVSAKSYTKAKNTDIQTYRKSSALEA
ncbi:ribonuclease III domain-containing protein, partial [Staphylococcus hominis]|uniref:ribonuclease III domain-containing protein n=1 Tax=Staphylococcus hominis TaxID=1290 RepID=UPI0030BDF358